MPSINGEFRGIILGVQAFIDYCIFLSVDMRNNDIYLCNIRGMFLKNPLKKAVLHYVL